MFLFNPRCFLLASIAFCHWNLADHAGPKNVRSKWKIWPHRPRLKVCFATTIATQGGGMSVGGVISVVGWHVSGNWHISEGGWHIPGGLVLILRFCLVDGQQGVAAMGDVKQRSRCSWNYWSSNNLGLASLNLSHLSVLIVFNGFCQGTNPNFQFCFVLLNGLQPFFHTRLYIYTNNTPPKRWDLIFQWHGSSEKPLATTNFWNQVPRV